MASIHPSYGLSPYCGAPPAPEALWGRWNLDPVLLAALLMGLVAYAVRSEPLLLGGRPPAWRRLCFYLGWTVSGLALVSPLCALSVSLLSARVGQHMVLVAVAAPLLALARDPVRPSHPPRRFASLAAAAIFAVSLWIWHAPGPYDATFQSSAIYWAMHVSVFGSAVWLWSAVYAVAPQRMGEALAAAAFTSLQMSLLGVVLTFANRPLYAPHALTTGPWGLTPLGDQQLAGVIMWIPAGLVLTAGVVAGLGVTMRRAERGRVIPGHTAVAP